jgi:hypothetical protein
LIPDANFAGTDDLGQNTLAVVEHKFPKTLADRIHFFARITRRVEQQDGVADFDLAADESNEVHPERFNGLLGSPELLLMRPK